MHSEVSTTYTAAWKTSEVLSGSHRGDGDDESENRLHLDGVGLMGLWWSGDGVVDVYVYLKLS
jgi:hypothetical protein